MYTPIRHLLVRFYKGTISHVNLLATYGNPPTQILLNSESDKQKQKTIIGHRFFPICSDMEGTSKIIYREVERYPVLDIEKAKKIYEEVKAQDTITLCGDEFAIEEAKERWSNLMPEYYQVATFGGNLRSNCTTATIDGIYALLKEPKKYENSYRMARDTFVHPITLMWLLKRWQRLGTLNAQQVENETQNAVQEYLTKYMGSIEFGQGFTEEQKSILLKTDVSKIRNTYNQVTSSAKIGEDELLRQRFFESLKK